MRLRTLSKVHIVPVKKLSPKERQRSLWSMLLFDLPALGAMELNRETKSNFMQLSKHCERHNSVGLNLAVRYVYLLK